MATSETELIRKPRYKGFYSGQLKESLAAAITDAIVSNAGDDPLESFDLTEELAITRVASLEAVKALEDAREQRDIAIAQGDQDLIKQTTEQCAITAAMAQQAMSQNAKVADTGVKVAAARINLNLGITEALQRVISELTQCAAHIFGDDPRVQELETLIRNRLQTPVHQGNVADHYGEESILEKQIQAIEFSIPHSPTDE